MSYIANATNLSNLNFTLILGAGGIEGMYFSSRQGASGGDSSISWTINSTNNSLIGYGGYEGLPNRSQGGGGVYTINNVNTVGTNGGGNGGSGIDDTKYCRGGALFIPTNPANLWNIALAFGVLSWNSANWWSENYTGNGGNGAGNGPDGYSRNGTIGGNGWVLIVYDNNA